MPRHARPGPDACGHAATARCATATAGRQRCGPYTLVSASGYATDNVSQRGCPLHLRNRPCCHLSCDWLDAIRKFASCTQYLCRDAREHARCSMAGEDEYQFVSARFHGQVQARTLTRAEMQHSITFVRHRGAISKEIMKIGY